MTAHEQQSEHSEAGRCAAAGFLLAIGEYGGEMTGEDAGAAFCTTVCDELRKGAESGYAAPTIARLDGFFQRIGEALWWQSEQERGRDTEQSFDLDELRRLIIHAHRATERGLGEVENVMQSLGGLIEDGTIERLGSLPIFYAEIRADLQHMARLVCELRLDDLKEQHERDGGSLVEDYQRLYGAQAMAAADDSGKPRARVVHLHNRPSGAALRVVSTGSEGASDGG